MVVLVRVRLMQKTGIKSLVGSQTPISPRFALFLGPSQPGGGSPAGRASYLAGEVHMSLFFLGGAGFDDMLLHVQRHRGVS